MALEIILQGVDRASSVIDGVGGALRGLGSIAGGALSVGFAAATAGAAALAGGLGYSVAQAMEAQRVEAQLDAVLRSTGGAAGMTKDAILDLASALSRQSTYSDDAILKAENLLLTFTNIGSETFPMATAAMVDMAAAMGTDVSGGAIQLGKALNDPIAGISALSRVGVTFTEQQKKVIERLVETGDVAGAQKVILEELNKEFGGSAQAQMETFSGQWENLKNRLDDAAETVGAALLPVLSSLFDSVVRPAIPIIEDLASVFGWFFENVNAGAPAMDGLYESLMAVFGPEIAGQITGFLTQVMELLSVFTNSIALGMTPIQAFENVIRVAFGPEVAAQVAAFVQGATDVFNSLVTWFVANWPQIQATAQAVFAAVYDIITNVVVPFIRDTLIPAFQSAVAWVVENWPRIQATIESVINAVSQIVTAVMQALQAFWAENGAQIMESAQVVWSGIQAAITAVINAVSSVVTTVMTALSEFWAANGEQIMAAASQVWNDIQIIISAVITAVAAIIYAIIEGIRIQWSIWGDTIIAVARSMWDIIYTIVSTAIALVAQIIHAVSLIIQGDWDELGRTLLLIWDTLWAGIQSILGSAWTAISLIVTNLINSVVSAFNSVNWSDIGNNIIHGIGNGISGAVQWLVDQAVAAAQAAFNAAKNALGIQSPSRLFERGVGLPIMQGWAKGIHDNMGLVTGAINDVAPMPDGGPTYQGGGNTRFTGPPEPIGGGWQTPPGGANDAESLFASAVALFARAVKQFSDSSVSGGNGQAVAMAGAW